MFVFGKAWEAMWWGIGGAGEAAGAEDAAMRWPAQLQRPKLYELVVDEEHPDGATPRCLCSHLSISCHDTNPIRSAIATMCTRLTAPSFLTEAAICELTVC